MAKDPGFIFYPGDYLRDTQCLSDKAQVAYDRIMCEHMRNTSIDMRHITVSKERINFFIKRLNEDEKSEIFHVLKKVEGGFQIDWVAESISARRSYSESRAKNRMSKPTEHILSGLNHMEDEDEIKDENGNGIKKENSSDEKYIIPQMCQLWYKEFPSYTADRDHDFEGMGKTLKFISKQNELKDPSDLLTQSKILSELQMIADQVKKDDFWVNNPIKSIANNIQKFYNQRKNPVNGRSQSHKRTDSNGVKSAKSTGAANLASSLRQDISDSGRKSHS